MKKLLIITFCSVLVLSPQLPANSYGAYGDDNPFVEAMLRMMEIFGLIDRTRLPLGTPYLPAYGQSGMTGLGAFPA